MSLACPDCSAHMPETAAFCPNCGRAMKSTPRALGKVGALSEPIAGALSYLTFIPAIFFLLRPPYRQNTFVRFHAFQCLLLSLTAISLAAALRLAALILVLIPTVGPLLIALITGVASIALVLLWIVLIAKAFQGETFKLPVLGDLAEALSASR